MLLQESMTDFVFFAYLLDVFVIETYQGKGLSKLLIESIMNHKPIKNVDKWILATKDTYGLYEKFGFESLKTQQCLWKK